VKLIPPQQDSESSNKKLDWMDLAALLLLVLALILRLPWMSQSLWYDEISVTHAYLKNIFHLLDAWAYDTNMPFHYTLMFFWNKFFRDTEFSLRFPPLLFGLGTLLLSYVVAKRIFDRKIALLTCFLLTISPVHIWYSTEARPYAGMMFFLLFALLAFKRLQDQPPLSKKKRFVWLSIYFGSLLLGTFSHFYMAIPVLVLSGISLVQRDRSQFVFLILNGITLLILVCFFWFKYKVAGRIPTSAMYLREFTAWEAWLLFFNWFPTGNTISPVIPGRFSWHEIWGHPGMLFYQFFIFALFLKGMIVIFREPDHNKKLWGFTVAGILISIPVFLFIVNAAGLRNTYIERSVCVALPFFFIVLALGVMPEIKNLLSMSLLSGLVLISVLGTFGLFQHRNACTVGPCKADWRSAAKSLSAEIGSSGEKAAVVGMLGYRSFPYYDSAFADHVRPARLNVHLPRMLRLVKKTFGDNNCIVQAFRREIAEVKNELETVTSGKSGKIAVLSFSEIIKKGELPYEKLYAIENPYNLRRSKSLLNWLNRKKFPLLGKESFYALNIYKFECRRNKL
jgi:uncharacterized membrane protein